ncbi:MAG: PAS domain-containing protein [Myxococcota bacterium]
MERSRDELLAEIAALRARVAELERPEAGPSSQRVRELLEQIPAFVWTIDLEARLTWWRGGALQNLPLDEVETLGKTATDVFGDHPEHPVIQAHRAALEGEPCRFEVEIGDRVVRAHIEPLRTSGEIIQGAIGVAFDITERVRAERDREALIVDLQAALDRAKALGGLVPICTHCKSMREPRGRWLPADTYLQQHFDADLSHGICPACMSQVMPVRR